MRDPQPGGQLTYAEFLAFCADKDERYEYVDGRAVAMGIPTDVHQRISKVLVRNLDGHFGAGPCEALQSVALWTVERERAPDILVRCPSAAGDPEPLLVVEILGANRGDDLGDKVTEYQAVGSIKQYLLIDSLRRWVRCLTRNADGLFVAARDYIGGLFTIDSIGYELNVDALYRDAGVS